MSVYDSSVRARTRDLQQAAITLEGWMRQNIAGAEALHISDIRMPESAGVANETLILSTQGGATGDARYIVRVDTPDHLFIGTDLHVHYRMTASLAQHPSICVPAVLGFEEDARHWGRVFM